MKERNHQGKGFLRTSFVVLLGLALLAPVLEAKERRGAQLVVTKKDGKVVRGELLTVKGTDLLIMDESAQAGVSVSLADVNLVKVVNRGKAGWILGGVFLGGAAGGGLGYAVTPAGQGWFPGLRKGVGALVGAGIGIITGGIVGIVASSDKKFPIVSTDPHSLSLASSQLRPLARDRS